MINFKTAQEFKDQCGYEIDGKWYPRVTKIAEIKAKPALYRFYGQVGFDLGQEISRRSAEEGTAIHEIAEKILTGVNPGEIPTQLSPSISAFVDFLGRSNIQVEPEHVERRIINAEHRYAGTIDSLATINGHFGVLDIKTSEAIYRDYGLQTAAYLDALKQEFPSLSKRWILRIDQSQACKRCGATLRSKGGRNKVKRPYTPQNGFNSHYGVVSACKDAEHAWLPAKGIYRA